MHLHIEPLHTPYQSPIAHSRRIEPIHHAHHADHDHAHHAHRHADAIPFADYLDRSNLTYPAKPFWADRASPDQSTRASQDTQPARSTPARPDVPRLGDVSPVEQQQTVHTYHAVLRLQKTVNLGSILDVTA